MGTPEHLVQSMTAVSALAAELGEISSPTSSTSIVADPMCMFSVAGNFLAFDDEDGLVDETGVDDLFTDMFSVGEYY